MSILQHLVKLIPRSKIRTIVHSPEEPSSVKLAFKSYDAIHDQGEKEAIKTPPLLVYHGLLDSKANWNSTCISLQKELKPTRRIIAMDARNHGQSPRSNEHTYQALACDVRAFLAEESIPKAVCLGHSMGGKAFMYLSLTFPQLVEKLIVVDISPISNSKHYLQIGKYLAAMTYAQIPSDFKTARTLVNESLKSVVASSKIRSLFMSNLVQKPDGSVGWEANLPVLIKNFATIFDFPIKPESGIKYLGPTTFIAGTSSDHLPSKDYDKIKIFFPNATFIRVQGAGHFVFSQKPKEFNQIVVDAIK